jgi:hypothetical protein
MGTRPTPEKNRQSNNNKQLKKSRPWEDHPTQRDAWVRYSCMSTSQAEAQRLPAFPYHNSQPHRQNSQAYGLTTTKQLNIRPRLVLLLYTP